MKKALTIIALAFFCSITEANPPQKNQPNYQQSISNGIATGMIGATAGILAGVKGIAEMFGIKEEPSHLGECQKRPDNYGPNCKRNMIERIKH